MKRIRKAVAFTLVALACAGAASSAGAGSIVLPRAGQVGVGLVGDGGSFAKGGQLGREFGSGFGVGVRLRYRMRYERAIGLSFDQSYLDARTAGFPAGAFSGREVGDVDTTLTRDRLNMTTSGVDLYQMFGTRTRTVKWLSVGAGLVQVSAKLSDGETQYPIGSDGTFLSAGAGIERFFYRSWAYDLGLRYQSVFFGSSVNHYVSATAGIILYAAY